MDGAARPAVHGARHALVLALLVLAAAVLAWRTVDLQVNHRAFLQRQGEVRHLRVEEVAAHRGKILDRNGEPLAISTPVDSVWANPAQLAAARARWDELIAVLGLDRRRLEAVAAQRGRREFVYLARRLDPERAARVAALAIPGVNLQREYRRYYPMGAAAAHVIGFTNIDDVGQEGIELAFDERLRGTRGARRVLRDRLGRVVEEVAVLRAPRPGEDLRLTLDRGLQHLAYRALAAAVRRERARAGSLVLLDAVSGEVLAMTNQPAFNPNNLGDRGAARVRNRAVTDLFEPGSTVKPFTIAAALESGRFRPDTPIETSPGFYRLGRYTVRDVRDYGRIDVATVIRKSSNVGASRIALSLEPRELWQVLSRVGFGTATASGFPGEVDGVLDHYFEWGEVEQATLAFGYGLSVSALQLARAYAAIANDGLLPEVRFVLGGPRAAPRRVFSAAVARELRVMLEAVVGPDGTAPRARVPGYRVAGKTGTVRKPIPGGYADDRYLALFAGMAPSSRPRLVAVVVIDEPAAGRYYGGLVAAPVFAEVMGGALRLLGVAPDGPEALRRRVVVRGRSAAVALAALGPRR